MDYFPAPGRNHLFVPGPTNIPEAILQSMNRNNEDHRSPAFPSLSKSVIDDVKQLFGTQTATSFIFPSSGTGAWESALMNTLSPGDMIIAPRMGQFCAIWINLMTRLNFSVDVIECAWGEGVDLAILKQKLQEDREHAVKAVCIVHNETSTGVTNDLAAIRKTLDEARHPALLMVDGVSSVGAVEFRMDEWRVDVALTGSQKALSMPTGLGILCASPKALEANKHAKSTRGYFDWGEYLKSYNSGTYWPYTPSVQMLYGLRASLDLILKVEGLENVIARHRRLADATRAAVRAWGLTVCARKPEWDSAVVTGVVVPPSLDSNDVIKIAWKKYNLSLGLGLGKVNGKVFRIGHLGSLNELQLLGALAGVELALMEVGYPVILGSGVAAAQARLAKQTPLIASRL
ncbi:hypothetical protein M758_6G156300 [Ceratodon purpureus]|nr:hypothetical protein M758_6G156300 [Ceratodon purpureus]